MSLAAVGDEDSPLTVYWQPGCTSCLKAREFLRESGLPFESINVREHPEALDRLAALGVRGVPVVARGARYVLAQDLGELARFVGIEQRRPTLAQAELVGRLLAVLDQAATRAAQLPEATLHRPLPGRKRTRLDLAHHLGCVVVALLDGVQGGALTYEHFLRKPPERFRGGTDAADGLQAVARALTQWWAANASQLPAEVDTYYGRQPLHGVLERTTWHAAQHLRQLAAVLEQDGVATAPLPQGLLAGLPLPVAVWDDEESSG
jgi:glutaredoxin